MSNKMIKIEELQAFIDSRSYGAPKAQDCTVGEMLDFIKHTGIEAEGGNSRLVSAMEKACDIYELAHSVSNSIRLDEYPPAEDV